MEEERLADLLEMVSELTTQELAMITELGLITLSEINHEALANSFANMAFLGTHSDNTEEKENYEKFSQAFGMAIVLLQNQLYIHKWTQEVQSGDTDDGKKTVH